MFDSDNPFLNNGILAYRAARITVEDESAHWASSRHRKFIFAQAAESHQNRIDGVWCPPPGPAPVVEAVRDRIGCPDVREYLFPIALHSPASFWCVV